MNLDDVPATKLLQPGNRASYRLLVAGRAVERVSRLGAPRIWSAGSGWNRSATCVPRLRQTLERADKFLGLAALVAVILAAVAVALAASRYLRRHLDAAAMMRCLGAPQGQTLALFALQFLVLGLGASVVGVLIALAGQQLLVCLLGALIRGELPPPGWTPALRRHAHGIGAAVRLRAAAADRALARAAAARAAPRPRHAARGRQSRLRRRRGHHRRADRWQAQDLKTGAIMIGGIAALLAASARRRVAADRAAATACRSAATRWRYGLANLRRRPLGSSLQIGALALGVMALLLLTIVRGDLHAQLAREPAAGCAEHVPHQRAARPGRRRARAAPARAERRRNAAARWCADAWSRSTAPVRHLAPPRRVARGALGEREFNLSWADALAARQPRGRRRSGGSRAQAGRGASLEDGIAETLGIKLGDTLTYDVDRHAGEREGHEPAQGRLGQLPRQLLRARSRRACSKRCPRPTSPRCARRPATPAWLTALVREFPNVLVIDVGEILHQVQSIMDEVARAVEFVFLFTLAGGVLVLEAAIAATQDERRYDAAVLRTLGASRRQLSAAQVAEFLALGALAGLARRGGRDRRSATCSPIACSRSRSRGVLRLWLDRHRGRGRVRRRRGVARHAQHACASRRLPCCGS